MLLKLIDRAVARRFPLKTEAEIRAEIDVARNALGHSLAERYIRGNVNIKQGEFAMREELNPRGKRRE